MQQDQSLQEHGVCGNLERQFGDIFRSWKKGDEKPMCAVEKKRLHDSAMVID